MIETTSDRAGLPSWVTMVIVGVALLAGGWVLWRYWSSPPGSADLVPVDRSAVANAGMAGGMGGGPMGVNGGAAGGPNAGGPANDIRDPNFDLGPENSHIRTGRHFWSVRGGALALVVSNRRTGSIEYFYRFANILLPPGSDFVWEHRRYLLSDAAKERLQLTDAQLEQLRPLIMGSPEAPVAEAQRTQFEADWNALVDATGDAAKSAAQQTLIDALEHASEGLMPQQKQAAADRSSKIAQVLHSTQIDAFHAAFERRSLPATNPTTSPTAWQMPRLGSPLFRSPSLELSREKRAGQPA